VAIDQAASSAAYAWPTQHPAIAPTSSEPSGSSTAPAAASAKASRRTRDRHQQRTEEKLARRDDKNQTIEKNERTPMRAAAKEIFLVAPDYQDIEGIAASCYEPFAPAAGATFMSASAKSTAR